MIGELGGTRWIATLSSGVSSGKTRGKTAERSVERRHTKRNPLLVVPVLSLGVMSLIARGRRHRLVALILFSFALADLAYPQSCCDELVNFFETAAVVSTTRAAR